MPIKRLPSKLVRRLKKASAKIDRAFHRLPTGDHRTHKDDPDLRKRHEMLETGQSVREFNVTRHHRQPIILKYNLYAVREIKVMRRIVTEHNRSFPNSSYYLLRPNAHPIRKTIIAMKRVNFPNVIEILGDSPTPRGIRMRGVLMEKGVSINKLHTLSVLVLDRTGIASRNLLVIGVKKGKPVFMPLVDTI